VPVGPLTAGGLSVAWLTLIVLIPLAAVVVRSFDDGVAAFWDAVTAPQAVAAIRLTVIVSLIVAAVDAVMGTLIAWVLVRDEFPGKRIVNGLIDLPFALPTIVAGLVLLALYGPSGPVGINVAYTRAAVLLALLFVTLPFVVRAVQPVLLDHPHQRQPPVQDRGRFGARVRTDREREHDGRRRGVRVPAPRGVRGPARNLVHRPAGGGTMSRIALRSVALGYLAALLVVPVGMVFYRAFEKGFGTAWEAVTTPPAQHAFFLTITVTLIAVPLNAVFGVLTAWVLAHYDFRGKRVLDVLIDLPFAVSPVVVGLALILVWGRDGWFPSTDVIFSTPGIVLATIFVSLPFVVREVLPVLEEEGTDQEQAAATLGARGWQVFWRITLPTIRWGLTYGVILSTARAIGEFGAVAVVSGKIQGRTETLTLYVEDRFQSLDLTGAYAAGVVLALLGVSVLAVMTLLQRRHERS
jgi:sulfate transport system permease protein